MQDPQIQALCRPQIIPPAAGDNLRHIIPSEATADEQYKRGSSARIHEGVDLPALVYAAASAIDNSSEPSVRVMGRGFCNKLFLISFSEGTKLLARIPRKSTARLPERIESEVATMTFVRCFLPGVPVAKVYAWNPSSNNPVGAPYSILEYVEGEELEFLWHRMKDDEKDYVLQELARIYARLSQPLAVTSLGNIMFDVSTAAPNAAAPRALPSPFRIGPIILGDRFYSDGLEEVRRPQEPAPTLKALWRQLYELQMEWLMSRWGPLDQENAVLLDPSEEHNGATGSKTYGEMSMAARNVQRLFENYHIPDEYLQTTLALGDFAFRNVIYDEERKRVTGLIDWEEAHLLPFIVAMGYPEDISSCWGIAREWLISTGGFPCFPPDAFPDDPERDDDAFRDERIAHTRYRARWRHLLEQLDHRMLPAVWAERELPSKIHTLAVEGAYAWLSRAKWIEKQVHT